MEFTRVTARRQKYRQMENMKKYVDEVKPLRDDVTSVPLDCLSNLRISETVRRSIPLGSASYPQGGGKKRRASNRKNYHKGNNRISYSHAHLITLWHNKSSQVITMDRK